MPVPPGVFDEGAEFGVGHRLDRPETYTRKQDPIVPSTVVAWECIG